jgi:hypothetical protein
LDHELRASDQVPLLLMMKEDRLALQKAIDSGDTDLGTVRLLDKGCNCSYSCSVSRLVATVQPPTLGGFLPFNRGRWFQPRPSKSAVASVCEGTEPRDAPGLLLFR